MFLTTFLWSQFMVTPEYPKGDLTGKTIIVTGASSGLGLEAARHFARLKCAKIILAVRTVSKGQKARESILASERLTEDRVEVWELDQTKNASVKAFAKRAQSLDRLDAVVENAGVLKPEFTLAEGFEEIIQVNVISTFLLALLLLPKLRDTAQKYKVDTNLAIVTSEVHHITLLPEADEPDLYAALNDEKRSFSGRDSYARSKAMEIFFIRELVKHNGTSPIITLVNPGLCQTSFTRHVTPMGHKIVEKILMTLVARTAEVGSRTLVAGACATAASHGEYMADSVNQEVAGWVTSARGVEVQRKVYEQTMKVLEGIEPGIGRNVWGGSGS